MANILHLTDLHYSPKSNDIRVLPKIINKIYQNHKNDKIDCLIFSGDLVYSGENYEDFLWVRDNFLFVIADKMGIHRENIFICCGNHDVYRDQEVTAITNQINDFKNEEELTEFFNVQKQVELSLGNIENYNNFLHLLYKDQKNDNLNFSNIVNDLYSIHTRIINNRNYNFVSINSAWRCNDSKTDTGNLLFPTCLLNEILYHINSEDTNILILHHPLTDLKYYNRVLVERIINENFHLMLYGHTHNGSRKSIASNDIGIISICSEASLSNINKYESTGYSLINILNDDYVVNVKTFRYDKDIIIYPSGEIKIPVLVGDEKLQQVEFRKKINELFDFEIDFLKRGFVEAENGKDFFDLFQEPVLKDSPTNSIKQISETKTITKEINLNNLFDNNNYIVYARDKYGKSILLYYVYLNYLRNFSEYNTIPILIEDSKKFKSIEQHISEKFLTNKSMVKTYLGKYSIKLLIDNYLEFSESQKKEIANFLDSNPKSTFIATCNENILSDFKEVRLDGRSHNNIFIHDLKTKHIRNLTKATLKCDNEAAELIMNKINTIFKQLNINKNYWSVSLFIYIFNAYGDKKFNNNFELIELYIDNLLGRNKIVQDGSLKIEYESLKEFLGSLAVHLAENYHDESYRIPYSKLINFIDEYSKTNRRFVIPTRKLFDKLTEVDLLKETSDDIYTFRLKGVFEYFIAYNLKDNKKLRDEIIDKDTIYLSFANELELVAGFNKKDIDYLKQIFNKTKLFFDPINSQYYSNGTADTILTEKSKFLSLRLTNYKRGINSLIQKEGDNLKDYLQSNTEFNSETEKKRTYDQIEINSENLERLLFVLCRTYRNSGVEDVELNDEILDFILDSACSLCFYIVDSGPETENLNNDFLKIFSSLIPLIIETYLFEALSQSNLEVIFLDKIEDLKSKKGNDLKIFVLYYMIIDLDLKENKKYIPEAIKIIKNNIVKHASLYKLLSYLIFSKYNSENTRDYVSRNVIEQAKKIQNDQEYLNNLQKTITKINIKGMISN